MAPYLKYVALACVAATSATARNCTAADLAGSYNEFRLTDIPGGSVTPGSSQVVSYDHPFDSPIKGIASLDLVSCNANNLIPKITSGLPATFDGDTSDKAGSITLRVPFELPAGNFHYRLTVNTASDQCFLHSEAFTSSGHLETCLEGESRCLDDTSFVACTVETALGTNGTYSGQVQTCGAGTTCSQTDGQALCAAGSSGPVVNPGSGTGSDGGACVVPGGMRCLNETAWVQCVGAGTDWSWSTEIQSCSPGTTCGPYQVEYIICQ